MFFFPSAAVRDNTSTRNKNPGRNNNKNSNSKQRVNANKRKQQQQQAVPAVKEAPAKPAKTTPAEIKKRTKPTATVEPAANASSTNSSGNDGGAPTQCSPPESRAPSRLCKTTYNTTAPMYGVSLTSGQPVTIVQKFPDLLQQVVYETC